MSGSTIAGALASSTARTTPVVPTRRPAQPAGDGAALVIHDGRDDYKSDPAGSAGECLACGVIRR